MNLLHDLGSGETFAVLTMYVKHFANYVQSGVARIFFMHLQLEIGPDLPYCSCHMYTLHFSS